MWTFQIVRFETLLAQGGHLQILGSVTRQLQHLGSQVLCVSEGDKPLSARGWVFNAAYATAKVHNPAHQQMNCELMGTSSRMGAMCLYNKVLSWLCMVGSPRMAALRRCTRRAKHIDT